VEKPAVCTSPEPESTEQPPDPVQNPLKTSDGGAEKSLTSATDVDRLTADDNVSVSKAEVTEYTSSSGEQQRSDEGKGNGEMHVNGRY